MWHVCGRWIQPVGPPVDSRRLAPISSVTLRLVDPLSARKTSRSVLLILPEPDIGTQNDAPKIISKTFSVAPALADPRCFTRLLKPCLEAVSRARCEQEEAECGSSIAQTPKHFISSTILHLGALQSSKDQLDDGFSDYCPHVVLCHRPPTNSVSDHSEWRPKKKRKNRTIPTESRTRDFRIS